MDENPSLNGLSTFGDINVSDLTADTAEIGLLQANTIIGGTLIYQSTTTNNLTINSELFVKGTAEFSKTVDFQGTQTVGASIITSGSIIIGNRLNVRGSSVVTSGSVIIGSNLFVSGFIYGYSSLQVEGDVTLYSTLNVVGAVSLYSTLQVQGAVSLYSTLNVVGNSNFTNISTAIITADTLNIQSLSTLTIDGDLRVSGTATISSNLIISGSTTQQGTLIINGATTSFGSVNLVGNATVSDILTVKGKDAGFGYEARINMLADGQISAITSYDTGFMNIQANNLTIDAPTEINNTAEITGTLTNSNGRTIVKNTNPNDYSLVELQNNNGNGLVSFINGSTRTTDGGVNVATIRNDNGSTLRIQDNFQFDYGQNRDLLGDVSIAPLIQGGSSNSIIQYQATITKDNFIYVGGNITSTVPTTILNFNGTASIYSIPSSANIHRAFIIQYTTAGLVNNIWTLPANVRSEIKTMNVGANKIYICGSYSSTSNITINNIDGTASIDILPLTDASPGFYAGFCIGFDSITGLVNRLTTVYGANTNFKENFISSVCEDAFGNAFVCGTIVSNNTASIRNFINTPTGLTLSLTNAQNGFIIRYDFNANYTGHWGWNLGTYACFVNDMAIVPSGDRLYVALSIFNLGTAITIPNWSGGGSSSFQILAATGYSTAHWTASLMCFAGVSTIGSPVCTARQGFGNDNLTPYVPFPLSSVCYSIFHDKIYWSSAVSNTGQIAFFNSMLDAGYTQVLSSPQGDDNTGIITFIQFNDTPRAIYGYPGMIWGYNTVYSGGDGIFRMREDASNGNVYLQGMIYTDNQAVFRGFFEVNSRIQFPPNIAFATSLYHAFSIVVNLNIVLGISYVPYNNGSSFASDICFPSNSRIVSTWSLKPLNAGNIITNYDQSNSTFSTPSLGNDACGVIIEYTRNKTSSAFFSRRGTGIGRRNTGIAELEVNKGIYTDTFVQCNEIRVNDYNKPFKFTDSISREISSLCRAWVVIDSVRTFQPVIKASMNVRYIDKTANGKYRIFFSQYAPHDRFCTLVSSTGFNSLNYTVFPFIDTGVAPGFPVFKFTYGVGITTTNTAGTGFDLNEVCVACFW
jgi:hypothetical protein